MNKKITNLFLSFTLVIFLSGLQFQQLNAQGTCATAVALVLDANCGGVPGGPGANSGDPTGDDGTDGNVCSTNYSGGDDYIFEYTATTTDALQLDLTTTNTWSGLLVTAGCPTTGTCFDSSTSSSTSESVTTPPMSIGQVYYIHISTWPSPQSAGQFCLDAALVTPPAPPANDDCGGAFPLTVNPDENCGAVTNGTIVEATASPEDPSACGGTEDDDVWFSFVATATTHTISLINLTSGTTDLYHSLWTGGCGSLTNTGLCSDPNTSTATGLTIGVTYFLRVYSWTSVTGQTTIFDVCIGTPTPPPANDVCSGAIAYPGTIGASGTCPGNNVSLDLTPYTNSTSPFPSCDLSGNYNAWFTFTAPAADLTFTSGTGLPGIAVYSGACGALVQIACLNNFSGNITGLVPGNNYIMEIWDDTDNSGTVTWCLEESPLPPVNDACAGAIAVSIGSPAATGSTLLATDVEGLAPCASGGGGATGCLGGTGSIDWGAGVWYSYTSTGAETITANTDGSTFDTEIQIFEGSCGALTCIGGDDDSGAGAQSSICWVSTASFAPVTYYIYIDGHSTSTGSFVLNLTAGTLPITLAYFKGEKLDKTNRLTWETASEENTQFHIIQRSVDGRSEWEEVGRVDAAGNSTISIRYELEDTRPLDLGYYRLLSLDYDGYRDYSEVISIKRDVKEDQVRVFPSPVTHSLTVEIGVESASIYNISILNIVGQTVDFVGYNLDEGNQRIEMDVEQLTPGVYHLVIESSTGKQSKKFVKQ